jgi:hypothetical protein
VFNQDSKNWSLEFETSGSAPINQFAKEVFDNFGLNLVFAPYKAREAGFAAAVDKTTLYISDAGLVAIKKDSDTLHEVLHAHFQRMRGLKFRSLYDGHFSTKSMFDTESQSHEFSYVALEELSTYSLSLMLTSLLYRKAQLRAPGAPKTHWLRAQTLWFAYTLEIIAKQVREMTQVLQGGLQKFGQEIIMDSPQKLIEWGTDTNKKNKVVVMDAFALTQVEQEFDYAFSVNNTKLRFSKLDPSDTALKNIANFGAGLSSISKSIEEAARDVREAVQKDLPSIHVATKAISLFRASLPSGIELKDLRLNSQCKALSELKAADGNN